MSEATHDTTDQLDTARGLLESRLDAIRQALTARTEHEHAQAAVKEAETADIKAYRGALSAGWSEQELKKIGLPAPEKVSRVQRRRRHTASSTEPQDTHPQNTQTEHPTNGHE